MEPVEQDAVLSQEDAVPPEKETVYLVTDDRWQREPGGRRDPTDEAILWEISEGGKRPTRIVTTAGMLELMQRTEPAKYRQFHEEYEKLAGTPLIFDGLVAVAIAANDRLKEFAQAVQPMTAKQAAVVRKVRVDRHFTWRRVARACHKFAWRNLCGWEPPANQVMGIALCERAAQFYGEDFRKDPWN